MSKVDNATQIQISSNVVSWALEALGALVLFFFGLGIKDIRDKLKQVDTLCVTIIRLEGKLENLEQRVEALERHR